MTDRKSGRQPGDFSRSFARKLNGIVSESEAAPTGQQLAKALNRRDAYVSERKNGKRAWTIDDIDVIADEIGTDGLSLMVTVVDRMRGQGGGASVHSLPVPSDPAGTLAEAAEDFDGEDFTERYEESDNA